jgi:ergothioneine biosynthesis protein EgtB
MDLKYCFFQNPIYPAYNSDGLVPCEPKISPVEFISVQSGLYEVGATGQDFHFDNETPSHQVFIQPFACADRLISNGEYLEFLEDGGYEDPSLWLSDGWAWLNDVQAKQPLYWLKQNGQWMEFTQLGLQPMDPYAPVKHINFYEAYAYAQWAEARLLTEFEWEVAASSHDLTLSQMMDVTWQWTQSAYQPYPGFEVPEGAVGEYNGKFMCNQMVLRGGCEWTPNNHARITYRNFFYPKDQWPMTGIRLAKDVKVETKI